MEHEQSLSRNLEKPVFTFLWHLFFAVGPLRLDQNFQISREKQAMLISSVLLSVFVCLNFLHYKAKFHGIP
jgi:hypothetical protein